MARVVAENARRPGTARLDAIIVRGRARADLATHSADDVVGYDADGLPA